MYDIIAHSAKHLNSPAHSSASRTNSNNSGSTGASGSVLSNKTSSDNCEQSHKSDGSSGEVIKHHTTRAGTSDSSKSPETISEPTEVETTLDSTLKEDTDQNVSTVSGECSRLHKFSRHISLIWQSSITYFFYSSNFWFTDIIQTGQQSESTDNRISDSLDALSLTANPTLSSGKLPTPDITGDKIMTSEIGQGSIKSIESSTNKIDSPVRTSGSERGRGFEPEGRK